ncbi:MAG: GNAT family N-acetyltransferase [Waddliaceae bacterium]|nr:GNAT family N-acetyltransferase [Waddliaceae bacterium]
MANPASGSDSAGSSDQLSIRFTVPEDAVPMRKWFDEPGILRQYPCEKPSEIDDTVKRWISFYRYSASLTAVIGDEVVGITSLYLWPYTKLRHQCQFGIIVDQAHRGKGVGTALLTSLMHVAKENFNIELLHLEVYKGNPAYRLYKRLGFKEFGRQSHWIKEADGTYVGRIFMERFL